MTDTFLDDHDTDQLAKHLREIATGLPEVLRIARREVSPPGGRTAHNPNGYSSRPPLNVGALDANNDITLNLFGWTRCLADDAGVPIPTELDGVSLARHLRQHADRIANCQWAPDCADEIRDQWRRVKNITEPVEASIADERNLTPLEVQARADEAFGNAADMVVLHYAVTGQSLKESTIRSWRKRGKLPERYGSGGEPVYWYPDVARLATAGRHAARRRSGDCNGAIC